MQWTNPLILQRFVELQESEKTNSYNLGSGVHDVQVQDLSSAGKAKLLEKSRSFVRLREVSSGRGSIFILITWVWIALRRIYGLNIKKVNGKLVHLSDVYDCWQINIIGNIMIFILVDIVRPFCFKKLDTIGKTVEGL